MKLYYENAYLKGFSAFVMGCEKEKDGKYAVVLSDTAFYPEGGGQPFDTGHIGDARVLAVHERNGKIIHYTDTPVDAGVKVDCEIDWERRFVFMQEHTGEHILSGIIKKYYNLNNVGFHMGSEFVTIDLDGVLTEEQLDIAEKLANRAVYQNIPVEAGFRSGPELDALEYRSKGAIDGDIRIVRVGLYDTCACCGIHCRTTGEIGLIKIVSFQKYKQGIRIFMLCGEWAAADYSSKNKSTRDISVLLSAKPNEITPAVKQLLNEIANLNTSLNIFKGRVLSQIAEKIPPNSEYVSVFESGLNHDDLRKLCMLILERAQLAAVFSNVSETEYKYAIGSKSLDVKPLTSRLNETFSGRGGGKKELTQGSLHGKREDIEAIINDMF